MIISSVFLWHLLGIVPTFLILEDFQVFFPEVLVDARTPSFDSIKVPFPVIVAAYQMTPKLSGLNDNNHLLPLTVCVGQKFRSGLFE